MPKVAVPRSALIAAAMALVVIAAFAAGSAYRGSRAPEPVGPGMATKDLSKAREIGRYLGVVLEVREDAVVVSAPDGPGPEARQRPVTLHIDASTRLNSRLKAGITPEQKPEEGGEPLALAELQKEDLVGFTGGSPFESEEIDAATLTLLFRPSPRER